MRSLQKPRRLAALLSLLSIAAGCSSTSAEPTLDQVRAGADRYRDVRVAIAEGYTTDNKCVTAEMLGFPEEQGAMGLHYVRRDLLGLPGKPKGRIAGTGTYTDFSKPAMLVYEPQPDGSLELVAVENLVFKKAWEAAGNDSPPGFRGNPYLLLEDKPETSLDEAHNFEAHYELHAWVFRDNPLGRFAAFNPNVTCRHHKSQAAEARHAADNAHLTAKLATTINPREGRAMLRSGAVVIDVREPGEVRESGALEGARNIPMSQFAATISKLPTDRPILLYCRSGRRSATAAAMLRGRGFREVLNLGAFEDAAQAGWPTVRI